MADDALFLVKALLAGGVAGMAGKSFVAPLDRVKILVQTQNSDYRHRGIISSLGEIVRREGVTGLFRGNGVQMLRIFPYGAIQFSSYEAFKRLLYPADQQQLEKDRWRRGVAGSLGGVCSVAATFPLDTVRAHLATHSKAEEGYRGINQTFRTIVRQGGVRGLYRGLMPSIFAIIPQSGLTFYFFEMLKGWILSRFPLLRVDEENGTCSLTISGKLLAGGAAGAIAQSVMYPLDVVRRRMQLGQGTRVLKVLVHTYRTDGIVRGLYRGMTVNYIRGVPLNAVTFSVYELAKQFLGLSTGVNVTLV